MNSPFNQGASPTQIWNTHRNAYTSQEQFLSDEAAANEAARTASIAQSNLSTAVAQKQGQQLNNVPTNPPPMGGPIGSNPIRVNSIGGSSSSSGPGSTSTSEQTPPNPVSLTQLTTLANQFDQNQPGPPPVPTYVQPPEPAQVAPLVVPKHAQADPAAVKAASDAAYASAKDRAALSGRASLDALREDMSSRNLVGSGIEGAGTAGVINATQGELGTAAREQSQADFARENAVADQVYNTESGAATTNYQGSVSQREGAANRASAGANTNYQGQLSAREQTLQDQQSRAAGRRQSLQVLAGASNGRAY